MDIKPKHEWTDEEKCELTKRALACDKTVVDDLIDAYIPTAMKSASWYVRKAPNKIDDIFGSGLQGLVEACNRACTGCLRDENIETYIKSSVRWAVQDFLRKDFLIPIPLGEFRKRVKAAEGSMYMNPKSDSIKTHKNGILEGVAIMVSFESMRENTAFDITYNDAPVDAMSDLFQKLGLSDRECDIVSMRMDDYTLSEIGEVMHLTKARIKQILDDIKQKVIKAGFKESKHKISGTKVCSKCETEKSLSDYYKRSDSGRETHKSICKACLKEARECVSQ